LMLYSLLVSLPFFLFLNPPLTTSPLFPYTTLFRSHGSGTPLLRRKADLRSIFASACALRYEGHARSRRRTDLITESASGGKNARSEEHTSELQSRSDLVCRLLLEKKKKKTAPNNVQ